jgi:hypothetical protein
VHSARSSLSIMIGTRWMTTFRKLPISRPSTTLRPMNSQGRVMSISMNSFMASKRNAARCAAFFGCF